MKKVIIGCDHVGLSLKEVLVPYLEEQGYEVLDVGAYSTERTDYPIYSKVVAEKVSTGEYPLGILLCGSGVGISITANKVKGVRAVVCSDPYTAKLSREHNDTNILSMGSRVVGSELAKMILDEWLAAKFEGGRHQNRIDMMED
ncbi:ribose 5-phosphate isomerase B [Mollicutes bacterium LVI A0078]|nr:ribose 5-phosphate isomerase B [Mollicutes bacterium LVI A0075]WOO90212.1 ribose 5-phosphate isomerase B [Mollicutes bacterium LVI A0078]